jgi:hypothetical protein
MQGRHRLRDCGATLVSPLLESLEIAQPRFQKFNSKYIESIKIACPISRLGDAYIKQNDPFIMANRASP